MNLAKESLSRECKKYRCNHRLGHGPNPNSWCSVTPETRYQDVNVNQLIVNHRLGSGFSLGGTRKKKKAKKVGLQSNFQLKMAVRREQKWEEELAFK
jgi:hypothetical protein